MCNFIRDMEILRKNQIEMLVMKNTVEMKDAFDELTNRLDAAEELKSLKVNKYKFYNLKWTEKKIRGNRLSKRYSAISRA